MHEAVTHTFSLISYSTGFNYPPNIEDMFMDVVRLRKVRNDCLSMFV
jgi:hypothetical protein